jgi:Mg2+-importing ATPase
MNGSARLMVCNIGPATQLGQISSSLRRAPPPSALDQGTRRFGMLIVRLTEVLVLFVLLINLLFHRPWLESFLFAVALAVGLTPELLPMIVSVTLARGAIRMAKAQVIVKRLGAIHDLGSMDVLCTDKTGTLTEAKIRLARQVALSGAASERVLELAWLNSHFQTGLRNPLDTAIVEAEPPRGAGWVKIDEVPFDFQRRRVSVFVEHEGRRLLITKGAPEDVIKLAGRYEEPGKPELLPLDDVSRNRAAKVFEGLGAEGFRALGVAWRELQPDRTAATVEDERDLVFAGFIVFFDPPKESAGAAIAALGAKSVDVKILSGDNERVTQHVCGELGIPITGVLTGTEIEALSDEALAARLEETNLFCRVTPAQKRRIILGLRHRGHVVGFLGDGINDAPSLHSADVGISVDSAVDVAKDAADIILLQHDLDVLERGVTEGRRAFGNIMKFIMMAMSSNFGNMFSMAGATLILPFLPMLPVQILLNNLLYAVSEMPIPLDEVDSEITEKPEHWDMQFIRNFMLVLGPVSSVFDFLTFGLLLLVFHAGQSAVPDRLVHRVTRYPGAGDLRASHATQSAEEPPASPPRRHLRGSGRDCGRAAVYAARRVVRLCPTICRLPLSDCGADRELPTAGPGREIGVLLPVATGRGPDPAASATPPAADRSVVTHQARSAVHRLGCGNQYWLPQAQMR